MPDSQTGAGPAITIATSVADRVSITRHTVQIGGEPVAYTATAGTLVLRDESEKDGASEGEKARASVFFVAYTRDDAGEAGARPITFSFNGGPGSSSVWLHLGVLGPRRVDVGDAGSVLPPPYRLEDNEFSILDATDLVFIDPVSTGYSRVVEGEKAGDFHGYKRDMESVGDFIRLFVTRHKRWTSPKFVIGESYGTTRAAALAEYLQARHGMYLNGVMLVSSILDFQTARFEPANDLPYVLILPSYTATAWYHGRLEPALQADLHATLREAEGFAAGAYASALLRGASLPEDERLELVRQVARLTGLSVDFVDRCDARVEIGRFVKELLRDQRRTVGRLDSRFLGIDRDAAGELFEADPSLSAITGPYTAAMNHYARAELEFENDLPYEVLTGRVQPWSYKEFENRFVTVSDSLRRAIAVNPALRVLVASGYFDLATPYFATEYTLSHLALDPSLRGNLRSHVYEAGHMMYVHRPSLEQMREDLLAFVRESVPAS